MATATMMTTTTAATAATTTTTTATSSGGSTADEDGTSTPTAYVCPVMGTGRHAQRLLREALQRARPGTGDVVLAVVPQTSYGAEHASLNAAELRNVRAIAEQSAHLAQSSSIPLLLHVALDEPGLATTKVLQGVAAAHAVAASHRLFLLVPQALIAPLPELAVDSAGIDGAELWPAPGPAVCM